MSRIHWHVVRERSLTGARILKSNGIISKKDPDYDRLYYGDTPSITDRERTELLFHLFDLGVQPLDCGYSYLLRMDTFRYRVRLLTHGYLHSPDSLLQYLPLEIYRMIVGFIRPI